MGVVFCPEQQFCGEDMSHEDHKKGPDDDIHVEVATPNGVFRGGFRETTTVEEVIHIIVKDRDLAEGDAFQLYYGETLLEPVQRLLASFHLPHKVRLSLVATGSGV
jgi:hypothetical protein